MNTYEDYHAIKNRQRLKKEADEASSLDNDDDDGDDDETAKTTENSDKNNAKPPKTVSSASSADAAAVLCLPTKDDDKDVDDDEKTAPSSTSPTQISSGKLSSHQRGKLMELFEVQLVVVICIFLDIIFSTFELILLYNTSTSSILNNSAQLALLRVVQSFTGFTLFFFLLEILTLIVTFRQSFFLHLGYILDLIIIVICLISEVNAYGKEIRLLNFLRVWRLIRLVNSMLAVTRAEHADTKAILKIERSKIREATSEKMMALDSLKREVESRRRVEVMLRGYKDEVDMLTEALKIAALDVAEAARDEFIERENEERENDSDDDDDDDEFFDEGDRGKEVGNTFVVKPDGTFEQR